MAGKRGEYEQSCTMALNQTAHCVIFPSIEGNLTTNEEIKWRVIHSANVTRYTVTISCNGTELGQESTRRGIAQAVNNAFTDALKNIPLNFF